MVFNSLIFLFFIAVLLPVYWGFRNDRWRRPLLFAANFLFYGWWDWRFTASLFGVMATTWAGGLWIVRSLELIFKRSLLKEIGWGQFKGV